MFVKFFTCCLLIFQLDVFKNCNFKYFERIYGTTTTNSIFFAVLHVLHM